MSYTICSQRRLAVPGIRKFIAKSRATGCTVDEPRLERIHENIEIVADNVRKRPST